MNTQYTSIEKNLSECFNFKTLKNTDITNTWAIFHEIISNLENNEQRKKKNYIVYSKVNLESKN